MTEAEYAVAGDICVRAYRVDGQLEGFYEKVLADVAGRAGHGDVLVAVDDGAGGGTGGGGAGGDSTGGGEILGCVTFVRPGSRYAEISGPDEAEFRMLAVDPAAQSRGVGAALVRACLDRAADLGYGAVAICTRDFNEIALRMYSGFGFRRVPERDFSPHAGVDLVALRLDLSVPAG